VGHNQKNQVEGAKNKVGSVAKGRQSVCPVKGEIHGGGVCASGRDRCNNGILLDVTKGLATDDHCYMCEV
jgi:hypothetical protein